MANEGIPKAHCDFCDGELAFGEGGISNADLFPGYPSGRRRQSLGCVDCMRQRGADSQQLALARKAARTWWEGRREGRDIYVTPDMLESPLPVPEPGATAERAAADMLRARPPASEEQEFVVEAGSAELAAAMARRKIPRGHVAIVRELLDGPEGKVRLRVKFGRSPLADLAPSARKAAEAERQRWRNRAADWWASSGRNSAYCDDNGCLVDGELNTFASKLLLPGDGFMPGGRPILCEECAERRLCEQFAGEVAVPPTESAGTGEQAPETAADARPAAELGIPDGLELELEAAPPQGRHAAPTRGGAAAASFQMRIRSIAPAGFVGKGVMVAGRLIGTPPRIGDTVEVVGSRGVARARVRDLTTIAETIAWAAEAGAEVTVFGGGVANDDYAFVLEGIDASAVAEGDTLRGGKGAPATPARAGSRLPGPRPGQTAAPAAAETAPEPARDTGDLELELEIPAPAVGRAAPVRMGTTPPLFGMRIERASAGPGAGQVAEGGTPAAMVRGLVLAGIGAAMLIGLTCFALFGEEGPFQSTGGLEGLILSALVVSIISLLLPLPLLLAGVATMLKAGLLPRARERWEWWKARLTLGTGVGLIIFGLLQELGLLAFALGVVGDSKEFWPEEPAARIGAIGILAFPLLVAAVGVAVVVKSRKPTPDQAAPAARPEPMAPRAALASALSAHAEVFASPIEHAKRVGPAHVPACGASRGGRRLLCFLKMGQEPAEPPAWCSSVLQDTPGFPVDGICAIWVQRLDRYPASVSLFVGTHAMAFCRTHDLGEPVLDDLVFRESRDRDGNNVIIYRVRLE